MRTKMVGLFVMLFILGLAGCSDPVQSTLHIAADKGGKVQIAYSGPGSYSFSRDEDFNRCTFRVGAPAGATWVCGTVELVPGKGNDVFVVFDATADRPFNVQMLGFGVQNDATQPEAEANKLMQCPAGNQKFKLQRFILFPYDLSR